MEHVEVLERLRGVLEHGKMGDKCLIAPDLVTAAIAALSAQQSPAEAQPVAKLVNRKDADGGKTTTFIRPTGFGMDLPLGEYPLHLHPPPSAPVGVERIAAEIRASLGHGATVATRRRWAIELEALAQQPAAKPDAVAGLVEKAYAGCTIWRGSLRVSVTETEAIEHRIDADEAFCNLVQRALDSLAAAWDDAALAQQPTQQDDGEAAPPNVPVGVKPLSEFMAEQEALHPGIHDKVQAAADELRESLAQQPAAARVEAEDIEVLKRLRAALPDVGLNGWWLGVEVLDRVIGTLTQQTAAGAAMEFDGTDREVLREFIRICREHKPVGPWPGERVCKAIERAMANEKPFRFIAEADMAPEREPSMKDADRMLSGPRRRRSPPPAAARGDVRALVAKLAAHVRPTCSELWDEAQAFLAAEGVQAGEVDCRCIDCGGNQPGHDPTCSYMHELHGEQPEARGVVNVDAWRALWLVLRQTGTVVVPRHDIASADWSKCQIEQTEHPLTGAVQFRATLLDAQPGGAK